MEKYSIETVQKKGTKIPDEILRQVYDTDDNVLFGQRIVKGKVAYNYIPGELMETGRPFIVHSSINYDGKGNKDLPKDALKMAFNDLPGMFPDNTFA